MDKVHVKRLSIESITSGIRVDVVNDMETTKETMNRVKMSASNISSGYFAPKPSNFACSRCNYRTYCPSSQL